MTLDTKTPQNTLLDSTRTDIPMQKMPSELGYIFNQMKDCVCLWHADGFSFTYVNQGAIQKWGYTEAELLKMTLMDILPAYPVEHFRKLIQPLFDNTQTAHTFETNICRKDGYHIPVRMSVQRMHPSSEELLMLIAHDGTECMELNNTLQERLKEMNCLYRVREAVSADLPEHEIFPIIFGELISAMQFPEHAIVKFEFKGKSYASTNYEQDTAYMLHNKFAIDGECGQLKFFYNEDKPFLLPFEQNLINAVADDIRVYLERKQTNEKLKYALKQTEKIQNALDAHAIVAITDRRGAITYVNSKFCGVSKYESEELLGQDHRILNSGYHPKAFFQELWKTISSGGIWQGEIKNRAKDGTFYWVATTIVPFLKEQKPIQYIAIRTEITNRKNIEEALIIAKSEAERANRAKDSFLATMSHEIRTPLGGMLGMLELLEYSSLNTEQKETLQIATDSGQNLLRILNDVLDWSKIDAGKLQLAPTDASLVELIIKVVNTYARLASAKSLILTYDIDARIASAHLFDPLRLSQVLNNLVSNAIKFTSKGHIKLKAKLLDRYNGSEELCFSVEDTGIGIAEDQKHHLFQDYNQIGIETTRMYGGTGLGLAICRRLIELMDGKVDVKSVLGKGSIFSVILSLPVSDLIIKQDSHNGVNEKVTSFRSEYTSSDRQVKEPNILVVDDHPINRKLMVSQLKLLGLSCKTANNGRTALEMWRNGSFVLIITDCHMPVMDGYQLTQVIRQSELKEERPHIPILGWSANALPEEFRICQSAGMNLLLTKPTRMLQLKEALETWLPSADSDGGSTEPLSDIAKDDSKPPIDSTVLAKFSLDDADELTILQDFMEQTRSDFNELEAALTRQNLPECARIAHRIKGASRMVGATELAAACEAMENAARLCVTEDINEARELLYRALEQLEAHITIK